MITSKDNKKIKEFNKLKLAKYRKKNNSFLVCNDKIIEEGFNTDRIKKIITCDSQYIFDDVILVSKEIIDYLSNGEASKYIGVCEYFNGYSRSW
jgi:tRNA G18 (ribose-2'-O)-methylase SpoU